VSVGIGLPGVSIGINLPVHPELIRVPGYPVYYAPRVNSNYFFYDGMYWLYTGDNWYASYWYNGPWELVAPEAVPLFVLRIPVRYYRRPPAYFHGWRSDAPPRWGEHWGDAWEQRRRGWDNWNRSSAPPPAPLPVYQRQYSGTRYPRVEQQQVLQSQNYRYQPQDAVVQQRYQAQRAQSAAAPSSPSAPRKQLVQKGGEDVQRHVAKAAPQPGPTAKPERLQPPQGTERQQQAPRSQGQDRGAQGKGAQEPKAQRESQQPKQAATARQQQAPRAQGQDRGPQGKGPAQESKQGQEKGRDKGEKEGGERNK
jgi:hypothetical protein